MFIAVLTKAARERHPHFLLRCQYSDHDTVGRSGVRNRQGQCVLQDVRTDSGAYRWVPELFSSTLKPDDPKVGRRVLGFRRPIVAILYSPVGIFSFAFA